MNVTFLDTENLAEFTSKDTSLFSNIAYALEIAIALEDNDKVKRDLEKTQEIILSAKKLLIELPNKEEQ
jgi:hypothetical protein